MSDRSHRQVPEKPESKDTTAKTQPIEAPSRLVQLKGQLHGRSYQDQVAVLAPDRGAPEAAPRSGPGSVQLAGAAAASETDVVHAAAAHATRGGGGTLPHLDAIQRSFGSHDVSGVKAHTGSEASMGARAMGAQAFASGDHVAFDGQPSLHTTAHEATHVVQQRAGVHLKGGVGQAGDEYERHADAVADKVVRGESAQPLLERYSPAGDGGGVQRAQASSRPAGQVVQRLRPGELTSWAKLRGIYKKYNIKELADFTKEFFGQPSLETVEKSRLGEVLQPWKDYELGHETETFSYRDVLANWQKLEDLTKLSVDAVPDFLYSDLSGASKVVSVHNHDDSDFDIASYLWTLYDSTGAQVAQTTDETFTIAQSTFSETAQVDGLYRLRCIVNNGENSFRVAHRNFNIYTNHRTQSNGGDGLDGAFQITNYRKTDGDVDEPRQWSANINISFTPAVGETVGQVGFIQTAQCISKAGKSRNDAAPNAQKARETPSATSVDRFGDKASPWFGSSDGLRKDNYRRGQERFTPGHEGEVELSLSSGTWGRTGPSPVAATMWDGPSGSPITHNYVERFETAAIVRTGADRGKVLGCMTWGFEAEDGTVTLMPIGFHNTPSGQFALALKLWNEWRATKRLRMKTDRDVTPDLK